MSNNFVVNGFPGASSNSTAIKKIRPRHKVWAYWFPILSVFFTVTSFLAGYVIAVTNEDENAWFSYISDGGALSPESCIFGIFLNYGAFFWLLTAVSQHIQLSQYMQFNNLHSFGYVFSRRLLLVLALISTLGLTVVANFQEYSVPIAHGMGAWLAFFGGLAYVWIYIIISCVCKPTFSPRFLTLFRGIFALITTFSLAIHMTSQTTPVFVKRDADDNIPPKPTMASHRPLKLDPDSPWYVNHLVVTISEWCLGIGFQIVVLTFAYEIGSFTVSSLTKEQLSETVEPEPELTNIKPLD